MKWISGEVQLLAIAFNSIIILCDIDTGAIRFRLWRGQQIPYVCHVATFQILIHATNSPVTADLNRVRETGACACRVIASYHTRPAIAIWTIPCDVTRDCVDLVPTHLLEAEAIRSMPADDLRFAPFCNDSHSAGAGGSIVSTVDSSDYVVLIASTYYIAHSWRLHRFDPLIPPKLIATWRCPHIVTICDSIRLATVISILAPLMHVRMIKSAFRYRVFIGLHYCGHHLHPLHSEQERTVAMMRI
jgi:hypothetical protein